MLGFLFIICIYVNTQTRLSWAPIPTIGKGPGQGHVKQLDQVKFLSMNVYSITVLSVIV